MTTMAKMATGSAIPQRSRAVALEERVGRCRMGAPCGAGGGEAGRSGASALAHMGLAGAPPVTLGAFHIASGPDDFSAGLRSPRFRRPAGVRSGRCRWHEAFLIGSIGPGGDPPWRFA